MTTHKVGPKCTRQQPEISMDEIYLGSGTGEHRRIRETQQQEHGTSTAGRWKLNSGNMETQQQEQGNSKVGTQTLQMTGQRLYKRLDFNSNLINGGMRCR